MLKESDHAYVMYEVVKCHDSIRNINKIEPDCTGDSCKSVDPKCARPSEIEEWLKKKKIVLRTANQSIDLSKPLDSKKDLEIYKNNVV